MIIDLNNSNTPNILFNQFTLPTNRRRFPANKKNAQFISTAKQTAENRLIQLGTRPVQCVTGYVYVLTGRGEKVLALYC